jgi:hypothetical protein
MNSFQKHTQQRYDELVHMRPTEKQDTYMTRDPFVALALSSGRKYWKQWFLRSVLSTPGMNSAGMIASLALELSTINPFKNSYSK